MWVMRGEMSWLTARERRGAHTLAISSTLTKTTYVKSLKDNLED
jgi:hypothetical protein